MTLWRWISQFFHHWLDRAPVRSDYLITRGLFLRLLGVVYGIAFWSLGSQIVGLVGENGIVSAKQWLTGIATQMDAERYFYFPTLCWIDCTDATLQGMCVAGLVLSALLVVGIAPQILLAALWVLYLSLVTVGGPFLNFQWDALLLETGLLAIALAPMQFLPGLPRARVPSPVAIWLIRLLLLKLMFLSGLTKLTSGDETWRQLTALDFHYSTQPLPTTAAWYAHQLPAWFQKSSVVIMFIIELVVPFAMFGTRRLRYIGCALLLAFQALLALTGNCGFFNLLTAVLCVMLFDDALLRRCVPRRLRPPAVRAPETRPRRVVTAAFAAVVLAVSSLMILNQLSPAGQMPRTVRHIMLLRSINGYGLFRTMTTQRAEITIEGSDDFKTWKAYAFQYKPGDLQRSPGFTTMHMPRLDWQMWFAALGRYERSPWLQNMMIRMIEGRPQVLALLEHDPFAGAPPLFLRARLSLYEFTDAPTRQATGAWWQRQELGPFSPMMKRDREQVREVKPAIVALPATGRTSRDPI